MGTPDGVIAGSCPFVAFGFVVLVIGEEVGFTIGVEFGFGVGVVVIGVPFAVVVDVALGLTIGLDVGFGFGLEFGFGVGSVVTGVPLFADGFAVLAGVVAAAGFDEVPAVEPAAGLLDELDEPGAVELLLLLEPFEPVLPPCVCAKETAATEPISNATMVFERELVMSPPCQSRTSARRCA
jgi:hypothetical protein